MRENERVRERGGREGEREEKEKKRDTRYFSRERTTRPGALCEGRKKDTAIYKASHHRNWASLRHAKEDTVERNAHRWRADARIRKRGRKKKRQEEFRGRNKNKNLLRHIFC